MNSYVKSKVDHLRRAGLVSARKTGLGTHGGACPDWLADKQTERRKSSDQCATSAPTPEPSETR